MEQIPLKDILADARRLRSRPLNIAQVLWAPVLWLAITILHSPEMIGATRTFWTVLPLPFLVLGFWATGAREKRMDEYQLAVERAAGSLAFRFTLFWLFGLVLLNASVGLPTMMWAPFGKPRDEFGWFDAAFIPVLFYVFAQAWVRKYRFGRGVKKQ